MVIFVVVVLIIFEYVKKNQSYFSSLPHMISSNLL
jgi:hypothetical protein